MWSEFVGLWKRKVGLACENLDETEEDDDDQSEQLGGREQVLNFGCSSHANAVYERQWG